jgi:DNA-binding LacI/PurR family transcriptional regulator
MEILFGAGVSIATVVPVVGRAPRPGHDVSAAAEHRMNRAVRQLKAIGCQASGIISDSDMLEAVRAETRAHDYDQVILATSRRA